MFVNTDGSKSITMRPLLTRAGAASETLISAHPPAGAVSAETWTARLALAAWAPETPVASASSQANCGSMTFDPRRFDTGPRPCIRAGCFTARATIEKRAKPAVPTSHTDCDDCPSLLNICM